MKVTSGVPRYGKGERFLASVEMMALRKRGLLRGQSFSFLRTSLERSNQNRFSIRGRRKNVAIGSYDDLFGGNGDLHADHILDNTEKVEVFPLKSERHNERKKAGYSAVVELDPMTARRQKWLRGLQSSSLFRPPPVTLNRKQAEILAYVELFGQFASESFVDEIGELVRDHYPTSEECLIDDVLATFVLHYPEHGYAVLHALLSCVIDGTLRYNKTTPPFGSFISLFSSSNEEALTEQWALACGEILRVLTHYNRPTFKDDTGDPSSSSSSEGSGKPSQDRSCRDDRERRSRTRLLTPWIVDCLLAAPASIRSDYFQWCAGFMGKYAAREELRPPTTAVGGRSRGKQPQLLPSSPRWAIASGAAVIVSVCDDEVSRYETADLTAAAVPALLIPPPPAQNEHPVVSGSPVLEPYARLFHRYYAVATPGATKRLLFGLLEAPPAWTPDALVLAVALVQLLRAADGYTSSVQLPRDWLTIHFLRPVGTAIAQGPSAAADAAASFLFHIFSQPTLLFPPISQSQGVFAAQSLYGSSTLSASGEEANAAADQVNEDAIAASLAELLTSYGADVERKICALWEAAYGLSPPSSSSVQLPELVLSAHLQPPVLSWNLLRALIRILSYLPPNTPSQVCIKRTFSATVETILQRTFPLYEVMQQKDVVIGNLQPDGGGGGGSKRVAMAELRAMVHCLFTESFLSSDLAAQLLSETLSLCFRHDTKRQLEKRIVRSGRHSPSLVEDRYGGKGLGREELFRDRAEAPDKQRGAVATFDSYVVAAVCALPCEVQMLPFSPAYFTIPKPLSAVTTQQDGDGQVSGSGPQDGRKSPGVACRFPTGVASVVEHTNRLLGLLELLLGVLPESGGLGSNGSSISTNEILRDAVIAAHMSDLLGHSRACLHSLTGIMRCKWDSGICLKASAVLSAIESNGDLVAMTTRPRNGFGTVEHTIRTKTESEQVWYTPADELQKQRPCLSPTLKGGKTDVGPVSSNKTDQGGDSVEPLPLEASDIAFILCRDRRNGRCGSLSASLKAVLVGKQHLALGAAALLCRRLISIPDIPSTTDGNYAESGAGQVVEALCNLASAFPESVAPFVISQADMELRPWIETDDGLSQQSLWRVNTRVVCLLSELLRLTNLPEVVKVVVSDGNLLRRATDGMTLDGEACKLPQLELLEAAVLAAQTALKWDVPNEQVAYQLFALLRERLPATVRCLSHNSAHVRAMGVARLRDMLYMESFWSNSSKMSSEAAEREDQNGCGNWRKYVEQCVVWEMHCRRAGGMSISLLANAASALGCTISI
ncbi:hypothetical protein R1flu_019984 [Riccia fluitans]|uniref:Gigantea n=1 Tax=Riccia fluitans TaxID=41844 RepID=A0ABD1ZK76_9MARC